MQLENGQAGFCRPGASTGHQVFGFVTLIENNHPIERFAAHPLKQLLQAGAVFLFGFLMLTLTDERRGGREYDPFFDTRVLFGRDLDVLKLQTKNIKMQFNDAQQPN